MAGSRARAFRRGVGTTADVQAVGVSPFRRWACSLSRSRRGQRCRVIVTVIFLHSLATLAGVAVADQATVLVLARHAVALDQTKLGAAGAQGEERRGARSEGQAAAAVAAPVGNVRQHAAASGGGNADPPIPPLVAARLVAGCSLARGAGPGQGLGNGAVLDRALQQRKGEGWQADDCGSGGGTSTSGGGVATSPLCPHSAQQQERSSAPRLCIVAHLLAFALGGGVQRKVEGLLVVAAAGQAEGGVLQRKREGWCSGGGSASACGERKPHMPTLRVTERQ
mgnify:CR=1 FL=1